MSVKQLAPQNGVSVQSDLDQKQHTETSPMNKPAVSSEIIKCPLTGENIPRCCCPLEK